MLLLGSEIMVTMKLFIPSCSKQKKSTKRSTPAFAGIELEPFLVLNNF
jgi:hypothetical protein